MSQVIAMARRLQDAEQMVLDLRKALASRSDRQAASVSTQRASDDPAHASAVTFQPMHQDNSKEPTSEELLSDLSLDENDKVRRCI